MVAGETRVAIRAVGGRGGDAEHEWKDQEMNVMCAAKGEEAHTLGRGLRLRVTPGWVGRARVPGQRATKNECG